MVYEEFFELSDSVIMTSRTAFSLLEVCGNVGGVV